MGSNVCSIWDTSVSSVEMWQILVIAENSSTLNLILKQILKSGFKANLRIYEIHIAQAVPNCVLHAFICTCIH